MSIIIWRDHVTVGLILYGYTKYTSAVDTGGKFPSIGGFTSFEKIQSKKNKLHFKIEIIAYFTCPLRVTVDENFAQKASLD